MATPWTRPQQIAAITGGAVILSAIVALFMLMLELRKANAAEALRQEEDRRAKVLDWQKTVVYKILQSRMVKQRTAMTFEQIRSEYVTQATIVSGIDLKKEELQDLALTKILLDLMSSGLAFETDDGKYIIQQQSPNWKFDRIWVQSDAVDKILTAIANESGTYTPSSLDEKLRDELKLRKEEYNRILMDLMAKEWVIMDAHNKLWSCLKPPPAK